MDRTSIAKLQKSTVIILPDIVDLFDTYTSYIRPLIDTRTLKIEQNIACSKPTLFIKNEKVWLLVNNFEFYYLLKSPNTDQKILKQEVLIGNINKDQFNFGMPFYELINVIAHHKKKLDIKLIYKHLNGLLTTEMNQQLFGKNLFAITTFCHLINITEQTYHNRPCVRTS